MMRLLLILISLLGLKANSTEYYEYIIQPGDNLTKISNDYNLTIKEIININKELGLNTNKILAGNQIFLPKKRVLDYKAFCFHPSTLQSLEKYEKDKIFNENSELNSKVKFSQDCIDIISSNLDVGFLNDISQFDQDIFWEKYLSDEGYSYYLINSYHFLGKDFFCQEKSTDSIDQHNLSCMNFFNLAAQNGDEIALSYLIYMDFSLTFDNYEYLELTKTRTSDDKEMMLKYIDEIAISKELKDYWRWSIDGAYFFEGSESGLQDFLDGSIDYKLLPYFERLDYLHSTFSIMHSLGNKNYEIFIKDFEKEFFKYEGPYYSSYQIESFSNMIRIFLWEGEADKANNLLVKLAYILTNFGDISIEYFLDEYEMFTYFYNTIVEAGMYLNEYDHLLLTNLILYENEATRLENPDYFYEAILPIREEQIKEISDQFQDYDYAEENALFALTEWKSLTAMSYVFDQKCDQAEGYHNDSFNIVKEVGIENFSTDTYFVPLTMATCFALNKNKTKLEIYNDEFKQISTNSSLQNEIPPVSRLYSIILDAYYLSLKGDDRAAKEKLKYFSDLFQKFFPSSTYREAFDNMIFIYLKLYDELDLFSDENYVDPVLIKKVKNDVFTLNEIKSKSKISIENRINNQKGLLYSIERKIKEYEKSLTNLTQSELNSLLNLYDKKRVIVQRIASSTQSKNFTGYYKSISSMQAELGDQEYVLSYFSSNLGTYALLISKYDQSLIDLKADKNEIYFEFWNLEESIKSVTDFNFDQSKKLYQKIFKPIEKYLAKNSSIFLYDSDDIRVPLSILVRDFNQTEKNLTKKIITADWLVHDFAFANIIPVESNSIEIFEKNYLGLANANAYEYLGNLPTLKAAEKEIQLLAQSSSGAINDILISQDATKENLIEKLESSYQKIVLATHTVPEYWEGVVDEAALILGSGVGDYFLTSKEISSLDIKTDMLVLSACGGNEEYTDLFKSFLEAGSNSIVHTNWDLESKFASEFTVDFFNNLWLMGDDKKHLAMQKTANNFLNNYSNDIYIHPSFWGNYTIAYKTL